MSRTVVFNHFGRIAGEVEPAVDAASRASAERLADQIRGRVRVRTGELRQSVAVSETADGYTVGSSVAHALSEEFGTSRQAPHPTFTPAAEDERGRFVAGVAGELRKRLR